MSLPFVIQDVFIFCILKKQTNKTTREHSKKDYKDGEVSGVEDIWRVAEDTWFAEVRDYMVAFSFFLGGAEGRCRFFWWFQQNPGEWHGAV